MQLVKLYDTSSVASLQHSFFPEENHAHIPAFRGLSKAGCMAVYKYPKPFISGASLLGKVIFKFVATPVSSKSFCGALLSIQFFSFKISFT